MHTIDNTLSAPTTETMFSEDMNGCAPRLDPDVWGERLTCFTAALCVWIARRQPHWWRPLVAGGPVLALQQRGRYWLFEHAPSPWLPSLGLRMEGSDDWNEARRVLMSELQSEGAVIIAGDVWHLPWQRGFQRWHAPHWFVLQRDAKGLFIDERIDLMTPEGPQRPERVYVEPETLYEYARSLQPLNEVVRLRELSIAGKDDLASGAHYRWLRTTPLCESLHAAPEPPLRLEGASACFALAGYFETKGMDASAYEQADDLWQALRQRELIAGAFEQDARLGGEEVRCHWQEALVEWRKIPVLLLHAKLRAGKGSSRPAMMLGAALRRVAKFEGRHLIKAEVEN